FGSGSVLARSTLRRLFLLITPIQGLPSSVPRFPPERAQRFFEQLQGYIGSKLGAYARHKLALPPTAHAATHLADAICLHIASISNQPEEMTRFYEIQGSKNRSALIAARPHICRVFHPDGVFSNRAPSRRSSSGSIR